MLFKGVLKVSVRRGLISGSVKGKGTVSLDVGGWHEV